MLQGPLTGWSFGAWWVVPIDFRSGWKQLWGADRSSQLLSHGHLCSPQLLEPAMYAQHSAQAWACRLLVHEHSKPCNLHPIPSKGSWEERFPKGLGRAVHDMARKPMLRKHQTRVTTLILLRSSEKGNQSLERSRQGQSFLHTQFQKTH